jgi:hypothetical protein
MSVGTIVGIVVAAVLAVVLVCGGASALIVFPAMKKGREAAQRVQAAAQLRLLAQGLALYAGDNNGDLPEPGADWQARLARYVSATPAYNPFAAPQAASGQVSYYYVPGCSAVRSSPTTIVLYENPDINHGYGGNIARLDGSVQWLSEPAFTSTIDAIRLPDGRPWTPHRAGWKPPD